MDPGIKQDVLRGTHTPGHRRTCTHKRLSAQGYVLTRKMFSSLAEVVVGRLSRLSFDTALTIYVVWYELESSKETGIQHHL
eukprot:6174857-Pleurochrysis_carterae.AAC.5